MKKYKTLLLIDSIINLFLGVCLLAYSEPVIDFFGLPESDTYFYPNILGAMIFGIGVSLFIEYKRKGQFVGLGLAGAISINITGGIVLFLWLISGNLDIPARGTIILWVLDVILVVISSFELGSFLRSSRTVTHRDEV